jgi:hypothetical protein
MRATKGHSHAMEEKLFWISRGFRVVLCVEIVCLQHGTFRAELESELAEYECPTCACRCRATMICEGVTWRIQLSGNWELVDGPLWSNVKKILLATPDELVPVRKIHRKPLLSKGRRRLLGLRVLGNNKTLTQTQNT